MNSQKVYEFITKSFLSPLFLDGEVTDISYNGKDFYYQNNLFGRQKYELDISSYQVLDFLRQIANLCQESFSIAKPILDVSIKNIRLNATYLNVARNNYDESVTFSIRIAKNNIDVNNKDFMSDDVKKFLLNKIKNKQSIIICGQTSTGKTELQKYLISHLKENTRAIIIDNVLELNSLTKLEHIDVTCWQYDETNKFINLSSLIKNSLRNNPDYLIIAESRGEEMSDIINAVLGGCPIITTLHCQNINSVIERMISLCLLSKRQLTPEYIKNDIVNHIHYYVYLKSFTNKNEMIKRCVEQIAISFPDEQLKIIYDRSNNINELDKYERSNEL